MVDYPAAANVFEFARQADRHRLEVCLHLVHLAFFGLAHYLFDKVVMRAAAHVTSGAAVLFVAPNSFA